MSRRKRLVDKELLKRISGKCHLCPENRYVVLDVHRINSGSNGGEYNASNVVVLCTICHRLVHDGQIVIDRWFSSTDGRNKLRIIRAGKEDFV